VRGNLTEASLGIIAEAAVVLAEMAQREAVQVPTMGRVAKGAEIGIVRRHDNQASSWGKQAVEILHGPHNARDVLDHVCGADFGKRVVGKGQGRLVEIGNHVRAARGMRVHADSARKFVDAAAGIEHPATRAYLSNLPRHSSSVSIREHRPECLGARADALLRSAT
jgi:hypothetical protein